MLRVLLFSAALALAAPSWAQDEELLPRPTASYTADQRIETGGQVMEAEIAVDGVMQRSEQTMAGAPVITIVRPEEARFYMLMPAMNSYVNMEMEEDMGGGTPEMNLSGMEVERVGEEVVNGEEAQVFNITDPNGVEGTAWITADGILVRFTSTDRQGNVMTIERTNIRRGEQDAALFEPPAGYDEIVMNPEVMRQMQEQQAQ